MPAQSTIRVLVVEDSITVRGYITDILRRTPGFEVAGEAPDGKVAIELCQRLAPDVITMDMMLPSMTGVAATEFIMAHCPTPILVVSSSMNRGEQYRTYDALAAGAVDVLEKPTGVGREEAWEQRFLSALRIVARIRVIRHPRGKLGRWSAPLTPSEVPKPRATFEGKRSLVAIGASTGGPSAVLRILKPLPSSYPLPVLLVIHISEPFGRAMADWLDAQLSLPVRYAVDGEMLGEARGILMAPPGLHLEADGERLRLTNGPERHSCRPSVDVLFESLVPRWGAHTVACLLTGMGKDGAKGLLELRRAGAGTFAQDEATSVVFGMPGEAVRLGAAERVLPIEGFEGLLLRAGKGERE